MNIDINKYKDFYNEYNEKISLACTCIDSNSCSKVLEVLDDAIQFLNKQISNLSDWDDSAKDAFVENLETCLNNLKTIQTSIASDWTNSEKIYKDILTKLNELKTNINLLEGKVNAKPQKSRYELEQKDEMGRVISISYPGYSKDYNTWVKECEFLNDKCNNLTIEIQLLLNKLDVINETFIQSLEKVSTMIGIATLKESNLVNYNFRDNVYWIVNIVGGYQSVLDKIGKQKPNKCLDYSYRYAKKILVDSNNEPAVSEPIGLTTSNPSEVLQIAAQEILEGRPSVIEVNGKSKGGDTYSRHFVTIVGLKEDANLSNLQQSDFLILDPAGAEIKMLDTDMGGSLMRRFLLSGENATYRVNNTEYVISVYSDPSRYISNTCIQSEF